MKILIDVLKGYARTLSDAVKTCIVRTGRKLLQKKKSPPHPFDILGEENLFEEDSKAHPFDALGKALFLATEDILRTYDRRPLHPRVKYWGYMDPKTRQLFRNTAEKHFMNALDSRISITKSNPKRLWDTPARPITPTPDTPAQPTANPEIKIQGDTHD